MGLLPLLRFGQFRLPVALLRATALELAILAGHLVLYPSGISQERPGRPGRGSPGGSGDPDRPGTVESGRAAQETSALPTSAATAFPPAVLLHGFIDNRSVFVLLRRHLARQGRRPIESLNYSPLTCDIRSAAELLGRHVEEVCTRTGRPEVDIVGHSLGGLIARYYVQRLGGDRRVRTLVTLGTPHSGTSVVPLASAHPLVRQMRPGSDVVEELRLPAPGCRTRFVSFWSDLDQLMVPLETACIDHPDLQVRNIRVSGIGHLALPVHPAVAAIIREVLEPSERGTAPEAEAASAASGVVSVA
ncbi:alpha/beta fold hydrolase [Streptomyces sp. NPDC019396]|uniref:esterase/lipase family protein n=1 Tax=Streptomyces sp. NPDC019396 TaxID=3154687 RepID=UPI0033CD7835